MATKVITHGTTVKVHENNQNNSKNIEITHDGTDGLITSNTGTLKFDDVYLSSPVPFTDASNTTLSAEFSSGSLLGGMNELKAEMGVRKSAVINIVACTSGPPTEVQGDRYILDTSGTVEGGWDGAAQNDIVEFDGSVWVAESPLEGWVAYVDVQDKDARFLDDGTPAWEIGSTDVHGLGSSSHSSCSLAELNALIDGVTLDDTSTSRNPKTHAGSHSWNAADKITIENLYTAETVNTSYVLKPQGDGTVAWTADARTTMTERTYTTTSTISEADTPNTYAIVSSAAPGGVTLKFTGSTTATGGAISVSNQYTFGPPFGTVVKPNTGETFVFADGSSITDTSSIISGDVGAYVRFVQTEISPPVWTIVEMSGEWRTDASLTNPLVPVLPIPSNLIASSSLVHTSGLYTISAANGSKHTLHLVTGAGCTFNLDSNATADMDIGDKVEIVQEYAQARANSLTLFPNGETLYYPHQDKTVGASGMKNNGKGARVVLMLIGDGIWVITDLSTEWYDVDSGDMISGHFSRTQKLSANTTNQFAIGNETLILTTAATGSVHLGAEVEYNGRRVTIKKTNNGSNSISVSSDALKDVEGASSYEFTAPYGSRTFEYNSTEGWLLVDAAGEDVFGTGADNRLAVWSGTSSLDSDADLTWDGTNLSVQGTITNSSGALTIDPTTYTSIGTGSPGVATGAGDLFVESDLEVAGNVAFDNYVDIKEQTTPGNPAADVGRLYVADDTGTTTLYFRDSAGTETNLLAGGGGSFGDDETLDFGDDADAQMLWDTGQVTSHSLMLALSGSKNLIIYDKADAATDFGHAASTNPTLYIQSADETSTSDYISVSHDQTNGVIASGAGALILSPATGVKVGTGTPTLAQSGGDDLYVTGRLETASYLNTYGEVYFNGNTYFQATGQHNFNATLRFYDDRKFEFGTSGTAFINSTTQTNNTVMLGLKATNQAFIICDIGDVTAYDFAHSAATNPIVYLHSANRVSDEWMSFEHDVTDAVIDAGSGHISLARGVKLKTTIVSSGTETLDGGDCIVLCDYTASGTVALNLPAPAVGIIYIIKDTGDNANTNNITLSRNGSENIEFVTADYAMNVDRQTLILTSDGTDWFIVAS